MHELEFDEAESAELLELIEGEGSCALSFDAIGRLYDELADRKQGRGCLWRLTEPERMEIARELEESAETIELAVLDGLVRRLGELAPPRSSPPPPRLPEGAETPASRRLRTRSDVQLWIGR